ncbi:MAG: hypothetical protein QOD26_669 [Betaproteobacteria bacterium]|jgi:hypothetical protein|nr:hypothetical protein [Betaproteobacteria bacterium]
MSIRQLAALTLSLLATSAFAAFSEPVVDFRDLPVKTRGNTPSASQVREAIIAAGRMRNWQVVESGPGQLVAKLRVRGKHDAEVGITYSPEHYSVTYRSSENLSYDAAGPSIHPNYNRWVKDLIFRIDSALATVDGNPSAVVVARPPRAALALVAPAPPAPTTASEAPNPGRRETSNDLVMSVWGSAGVRRGRAWTALVAEWEKQAPDAVQAVGARLLTVQEREPIATGQPGTLVGVTINSFRFVSPGRRYGPGGGLMAGNAHLNVSVRFFDLMTGNALGDERSYSESSRAIEGVFAETSNVQVRNMVNRIMSDWRDSSAAAALAPAPRAAGAAPATSGDASEVPFWESVRDSKNPAELQAYLDQYPNGRFAGLAKVRLAALSTSPPRGSAVQPVPATAGPPQPGDSWTYRLTYPYRFGELPGSKPSATMYAFTVGAISDTDIVEQLSIDGREQNNTKHGKGGYLVSQGVSVYSPYLAVYEPILAKAQLGRVEILDPPCNTAYTCEASATITSGETITVAAGRFSTTRIAVRQSWRSNLSSGDSRQAGLMTGGRVLMIWYAPAIKRAVKFSSRRTIGELPPVEPDFDLELVSYRLK